MSTHARPIAGAFLSLPWTFRLLNLVIFINIINIMLPVDYGYLHMFTYTVFIVIWAVISVFRAGFGRFRPVSLGFVKKTHPIAPHNISRSSPLDHLQSSNSTLGMWVPHTGTIFQAGMH